MRDKLSERRTACQKCISEAQSTNRLIEVMTHGVCQRSNSIIQYQQVLVLQQTTVRDQRDHKLKAVTEQQT